MLKRTAQTMRAVAEVAGIIAPSVQDAQTAAEAHRQSLIAAQRALEVSTQALQAAHDRGAEDGAIESAEAALVAAKLEATRAEARYRGAETRLQKAKDADATKAKDAMRVKFDAALAVRAACAERIDTLAAEIAAEVRTIDAQDGTLAEASRAGVAAHYGFTPGRAQYAAQMALSKHGAIPRAWMGADVTQHPDASEVTARDNGALTAA